MLSKEKIKQIQKLHDKKGRTESGLFLVEGRKMILELLASDWKYNIEELYVSEKFFEEIGASSLLAGENGVRCLAKIGENGVRCFVENELLSKISTLEKNGDGVAVVRQNIGFSYNTPYSNSFSRDTPHPNLLLKEKRQVPTETNVVSFLLQEKIEGGAFEEGMFRGEKNIKNWILVLDGIRDPGNMGTILRTAAWFGITKILCSPDCVEIYNPKVVSATMGAIFHVDVSYFELETFYKNNTDLPIFGAELGGENISEIIFPESGILVMGSESHGISEISRNYMTQGILIPKTGYGESLNVGIATGILLSHIVK